MFTPDGYRALLTRALDAGYVITSFAAFSPPDTASVLLLRHDLDHDLRSAEHLAELECDVGVRATYFVQTACDFYNLLSVESRRILARLVELGHEIGLHYEARRYVGPQAAARLAADVRLLEDLTGQAIISAAQHIPVDDGTVELGPPIRHEAYEARFTSAPMHYISDSLMRWRQATPGQLLDQRASFQFLTHPECWIGDHSGIDQVLDALLVEEAVRLRHRFAATAAYYHELLATRAERDRAFRRQRGLLEPDERALPSRALPPRT